MAMDALRFLRGPEAEQWIDLFLKHHTVYLEGSKAPDDQFKDFKNHVLHVRENFWGGAVGACQKWYDKTVDLFQKGNWEEGVFAAGVMSHYFTDPHMPLHTGQSEAEGPIHRAAEWSITKTYHELQNILEVDHGGYPRLEIPNSEDWLGEMVRQGALRANPHYEVFIDHYNLAQGIKEPTLGLDQELKDRTAQCIGFATIGYARILERALEDAGVRPPLVDISLQGVLTTMALPVHWVTSRIIDGAEREQIRAMYEELQLTGKVIKNLPEDEKALRKQHAAEVLKKTVAELNAEPARKPGKAYGQGAKDRFRWNVPITRNLAANKPRGNVKLLLQTPLPTLAPLERTAVNRRRRKGYVNKGAAAGIEPRITGAEETALRLANTPANLADSEQEQRIRALAAQGPVPETTDDDVDPLETDTLAAFEKRSLPPEIPKRRRPADEEVLENPADTTEGGDEELSAENPSRIKKFFSPLWNGLAAAGKRVSALRKPATRAVEEAEAEPEERTTKTRGNALRESAKEVAATSEKPEPKVRPEESARVSRLNTPASVPSEASERVEAMRKEAQQRANNAAASHNNARRLRFHLEMDDDVENAPSIGNKTADRLKSAGVRTVSELMSANPESLSSRLKAKHITPQVIRDWQTQADLAARIPEIRGHDAQILVGSGITDPAEVCSLSPEELLELIQPYVNGEEGERILRGSTPPDLVEVANWIDWAKSARSGRAA